MIKAALVVVAIATAADSCEPTETKSLTEHQADACRAVCAPREVHRFVVSAWNEVECECSQGPK